MPNPFDQFDGPQGVTVPLGPRDPQKAEATALDLELKRAQLDKTRKDASKEQVGDKEVEALAKLYVANKLVPPSRPNEVAQKAVARAMELDPEYDPELAGNRAKAIKDFSGNGQAAQVVRSVNRLASHLNDMYQASEKMGGPNLGLRPLNKLVASVEQQGMPELVSQYDAGKPFVATELDKIMKGTGQTTVSGIQEAVGALDRARSLDERRAAFKQIGALVHGALDPVKQGWNSAYGGTKAPPMWVSPQAAKIFGHIDPDNAGTFGGDDWRGLPGLKGDGSPGQGTPPDNGGGAPPAAGGGGLGGPSDQIEPATGDTRTEISRGPVEQKLAAMLAGGTPSANIRAYAKANDFPVGKVESVLAWRALNPTYKGGYDVSTEKVVPTTAFNRFAASPTGALLTQAGDAMTGGFGDEAVGAVQALRSGQPIGQSIRSLDFAKQMQAQANPKAALAGNILGGTTAMLGGGAALRALGVGAEGSWLAANPIKAAAIGDASYGGVYGAGENNDNRVLGAAVGIPAGGLGSLAGAGAARALGAGLTGVVNPAVQRLRALNIPLTAGEALGGGWKKAQDAMTSVFGPGNMVARRYEEGRRALNEAAFNAAGQTVGTPINAVGQEGIGALNTAKNQAYSNALDPVQLNLNTPEAIQELRGAVNAAQNIPNVDQAQEIATGALANYIGNAAPAGRMTGRDFQQAYRGLARTSRTAAPRMYGHEIGEALGQGQDALVGALQEQNPGAFEGFVNANSANRHLSVLNEALNAAQNQVSNTGEQLFTPAQLGRAATNNARTYNGRVGAASGNRPFNQLALDAQQVMSSKLGDSGTASREAAMRLATGAGLATAGGGAGYATNGGEGAAEGAAIPLGALTLLGTRRGQQALTAALLNRVAPFRIAGTAVRRNPQIGGDILAAYGIPTLTTGN